MTTCNVGKGKNSVGLFEVLARESRCVYRLLSELTV